MMVFQIGSSIEDPDNANDLDLIVVCDKPVDICVYTESQWKDFMLNGGSDKGHRVVLYPSKMKGNTLNGNINKLL